VFNNHPNFHLALTFQNNKEQRFNSKSIDHVTGGSIWFHSKYWRWILCCIMSGLSAGLLSGYLRLTTNESSNTSFGTNSALLAANATDSMETGNCRFALVLISLLHFNRGLLGYHKFWYCSTCHCYLVYCFQKIHATMMTELQEKVAWQVFHLVTEIQVQPVTSPLPSSYFVDYFCFLPCTVSLWITNTAACKLLHYLDTFHAYTKRVFFYDKF